MRRLRYFTETSVDELRDCVQDPERLEWYYSGTRSVTTPKWPESRLSSVESRSITLKIEDANERPGVRDAENARLVHDHMSSLSRHQAAEERLWVYLCHVECADYLRTRWLRQRPTETEEAVSRVLQHFFVRGARGLIRNNGISRLWWLGKMAREADAESPEKFLEIVLHRQDVQSSLLGRQSVSHNVKVLRAIHEVMKVHWDDGRALFQRDRFRAWMRAINRRGGVVLLDSLSESGLRRLLDEEAEAALKGK